MKKVLVFTLLVGILLTGFAFAENETDVKFNVAARYYPATLKMSGAPNYHLNALWLEGNLFVGKDHRWKGTVEWFKGNDTKRIAGISTKIDNSQFIGRVGYDVWEKFYVTANYKSNPLEVSPAGFGTVRRTFKGWGFGVQKHFDLSEQWPAFAAVHYYPKLHSTNSLDFRGWEYQAGVKYKWPKVVDIEAGYRGENWKGFNNASNTNIDIYGPYIGISKEF